MRLLAALLAACLFLSCNPKPVPERQSYKRDDGNTNGQGGKISRDFNVVDDMLSTLDQCFHILEEAVKECGGAGENEPTSKSQELSDEREESDKRRKGSHKEPPTEPPTTPPTTPPRVYTGPSVIIVHNQEEGLEKTADQQGIGNRDREPSRASEEPPSSPEVIVVIDVDGKKSNDESAGSQALRKDDSLPSDQEDGEEEEEEEKKSPPTASVVVVHIDRGEDGSESADASSQSVGKGRNKGRNKGREKSRGGEDEEEEKPTPDVIVIHINRNEDTGQEVEDATSLAVEQSRRKPNEPPTEPTTALPTTEGPPPKVIIIESDGLRRPEPAKPPTNPPTNPPTEPPTHRSVPSTDVIIIHRDEPSTAEIESDIEYAMQYWFNRGPSDPPTVATQAPPPTARPRGPVRVIIIPDAREESVDEIVSRVTAYSVGGRFHSRNKNNEEEKSTETPPTETPVGPDSSPLIIVLDRRPIAIPTTPTNAQTEPPPDDSLALKTIELATKKLKSDALKPVSSQAMELERGGMFMSPAAQESSREKENKTENDSADGRNSSSSRRNKTTDATDLPTEEPSATIETDASDSLSRGDSATSTTEEPSNNRHSQSDSTADTEEPSESTTATTDQPTDSEATDVSTHNTNSDRATHSPDTATHSPDTTTDTEPEAEAGEWPMESVFYEQSARSSSAKSKKADVMDKALEDYLHFRRKRQGGNSYYQFTPQDCLQLFSSVIETHYADKLKFLDK